MGLKLPPAELKLAIEMHPGLNGKRKKQLQDMVEQAAQAPPPPGAQQEQELRIEKLEAEIVAIRSGAYLDLTAGETNMAKVGVSTEAVPVPDIAEGGFAGPMQAGGPPPAAPPPQGPPAGPAMGPGGPMPLRPTLPPPAPVTGPPAGGPGPILHPSSRPGDSSPAHAPGGLVGMMTGPRAA
jgi:hypothetical protein